ncbi:MAG: class I SAM-dependent methyltransferase [Hyphomicrobiales bacterium]|nr:class I SAM-dependent methyltransferase [Hyphomicrobiales bacterium]
MGFSTTKNKIAAMFSAPEDRTGSGETGRCEFAHGVDKISRTAIIHLATRINAKRYLEIGVRDGRNLRKIYIDHKEGVDPADDSAASHRMTSDEYFAAHGDQKFDIIFIDGLHLEAQVAQDIENALSCLNEGGYIVLHDCNPPTEFHQRENYEVDGKFPPWNGTGWRAWLRFRATRPDLSMQVVDTDYGVGVLTRGRQQTIPTSDISYSDFAGARNELLPLISVKKFLSTY